MGVMKIVALVSGGVDSSVALALLKEQGHDITAYYLKIWLEDELAFLGDCPWEEDLAYVEKVCKKLDVPLKILSLQQEYWDQIVSYTISEVKAGRTPSPDIFCNQRIKFGSFYSKIDDSFEKVATGHYAQIEEKDGLFILKKAKDLFKDQTYFLSHLSQEQLKRAMFPVGGLLKSEVRELAAKYDLANKDRKDSQGICFLGKIKFSDFIKHHLGTQTGDIIDFETGKKLGQHDGFWYYTVGQRRGIRLSDGPWYVVSTDVKKNIVHVSNKYFAPEKKRDEFTVAEFNWISGQKPKKTGLTVKVRHGQEVYNCKLNFIDATKAVVKIDRKDQGLAQGQFAIFYDKDICLGCGVIC